MRNFEELLRFLIDVFHSEDFGVEFVLKNEKKRLLFNSKNNETFLKRVKEYRGDGYTILDETGPSKKLEFGWSNRSLLLSFIRRMRRTEKLHLLYLGLEHEGETTLTMNMLDRRIALGLLEFINRRFKARYSLFTLENRFYFTTVYEKAEMFLRKMRRRWLFPDALLEGVFMYLLEGEVSRRFDYWMGFKDRQFYIGIDESSLKTLTFDFSPAFVNVWFLRKEGRELVVMLKESMLDRERLKLYGRM